MFESNRVQYYFFKYLPLGLGIQSLIFLKYTYKNGDFQIPEIIAILLISAVFIWIFYSLKDMYKIVCIGRNSITFDENKNELEFTWLDVSSIQLDRYLGLYHLKLKDRKKILFTSYGSVSWLTGDTSEMGQIITKMKTELGI